MPQGPIRIRYTASGWRRAGADAGPPLLFAGLTEAELALIRDSLRSQPEEVDEAREELERRLARYDPSPLLAAAALARDGADLERGARLVLELRANAIAQALIGRARASASAA